MPDISRSTLTGCTVLVFGVLGCWERSQLPDGAEGPADAGVVSDLDAGVPDAGSIDMGVPDSGAPDASAPYDAGPLGDGFQVSVYTTWGGGWDGWGGWGGPVLNAQVWLREATGQLHEAESGESGVLRFELEQTSWPIEVTVFAEGYAAFSVVGLELEDLDYLAERSLVSEDRSTLHLRLERIPSIHVSGTYIGGEADVLLVTSSAGGEPFSGPPGPWSLTVPPHPPSTRSWVVGWLWSQRPGPGPRSLEWDVDVAVREFYREYGTSGLELDFEQEVATTRSGFTFRLPSGARFYDEAVPAGAQLAWGEEDGRTMLIGFPERTRWDPATREVTVETRLLTALPSYYTPLGMAQLSDATGVSTVFVGGISGEAQDAAFLLPPALHADTADGITWGEPVRWTPDDFERIEAVVYLGGRTPWTVQAWGAARGAAVPPDLPEPVVRRIVGEAPLQALVFTCDLYTYGYPTNGHCGRQTQSAPIPVAR